MKKSNSGIRSFQGLCRGFFQCAVLAALMAASAAPAQDLVPAFREAEAIAAPPAPPNITNSSTKILRGGGPLYGAGPSLYSIGQPTDEEQFYLELANRSRANPTAEGVRLAGITNSEVLFAYSFFNVNLGLMQAEFATNPAVPPLAMNAQLLSSSRLHSGDMFTNKFQGHTSTDGSTLGDRLTRAGYSYRTGGENVYSSAETVIHGHAAFNVDWGTNPPSVGGMQDPAGHRVNIHSPNFREVGMGVVNGTNGIFGPQFITQDFGTRVSATPLITGVAYYDLNGNGFYDAGEGIGSITVTVSNANYYAVTADSGGYTVPVDGNGVYAIAFTGSGLATQRVVTVSGSNNLKVDFAPQYVAPSISGPNPAGLNVGNTYTFSAVGGASSYDYRYSLLSAFTLVEGAENGLSNMIAGTSAGYNPVTNGIAAAGTYSFHLCHPLPVLQTLMFKAMIRPGATSQLSFSKRLGWATTNQVARAQISTNNGVSWVNIWGKTGAGTSGETSFTTTNVSLTPYAGLFSQIRFTYEAGASYYNNTTAGVGLYLDKISITGADEVLGFTTNSTGLENSFVLTPSVTNNIVMNARARITGHTLNWGPAFTVPVVTPPPSLRLLSPVIVGTQAQVDFTVANYRSGMTFQLWRSTSPTGTWAADNTAVLTTLSSGSKYRETTSTAGTNRWFYRIRGTY